MGWFRDWWKHWVGGHKAERDEWNRTWEKSLSRILDEREIDGKYRTPTWPWAAPVYEPQSYPLPPIEEDPGEVAAQEIIQELRARREQDSDNGKSVYHPIEFDAEDVPHGILTLPEEAFSWSDGDAWPNRSTMPLIVRGPVDTLNKIRIIRPVKWPPPDPSTVLSVLRLGVHPANIIATNTHAAWEYHCALRLRAMREGEPA